MTDPSSPESSSKSSILSNFSLSAAAVKAGLRDAAELPSWALCAVDDHREAGAVSSGSTAMSGQA
ncbi:MAG: hypothetical protein ACLSVD_01655 [Eggerthellaceae bacterium]